MQLRMKPHQWMATFGLLGLVLATALGLILTREPEQSISNAGQAPGGEALLIDEHPLQTARALATLASGSDEQRLAQQAMKVADRELDLARSEEHTSELQSQSNIVCRLLLEKKKKRYRNDHVMIYY